MTFHDESTDFYEKYLVDHNGLELKLGIFEGMEYAVHFYKWNAITPDGVSPDQNSMISIQSLWKRVEEPRTQYLEDYGTLVINIEDIPTLSVSLRKVRDDLVNGKVFERDPEWRQNNGPDRDWLEHGLQNYGGELVFCKDRIITYGECAVDTDYYEILAHVHQWPVRNSDRSKVQNHVLITGFSKNLSFDDSPYESHDYCSIFVSLNKVEEFISILEKMATDIVLQNEKANIS